MLSHQRLLSLHQRGLTQACTRSGQPHQGQGMICVLSVTSHPPSGSVSWHPQDSSAISAVSLAIRATGQLLDISEVSPAIRDDLLAIIGSKPHPQPLHCLANALWPSATTPPTDYLLTPGDDSPAFRLDRLDQLAAVPSETVPSPPERSHSHQHWSAPSVTSLLPSGPRATCSISVKSRQLSETTC